MKISTTKQSFSILITLLFSALLFTSGAAAEHHEGPMVAPAELVTCTFRKGKDMDDLDEVTARWNAWMDEKGLNDYMAVTLRPYFNDPGLEFDVGWMGFWRSGKAMGESLDVQRKEGADVIKEFNKVIDCGMHASFASRSIVRRTDPVPETGVVRFTNCVVAEGKSGEEVTAALDAWGEYQVSQGITGPSWLMYPSSGGGDADFDFKFVTGHRDWGAFGAAFDQLARGGGYQKASETLGDMLECDVSRVYEMRLQRAIPQAE